MDGEVGIDEVGRGCLAGPLLVVAARVNGALPLGIKDSKLLTRSQREAIYQLLITNCQFGEGWVKPAEIDRLGLTAATRLGVRRALKDLGVSKISTIIIDGNINYAPSSYKNVQVLIDADALVPIVSAASIYAKVIRDQHMRRLAAKYPHYGWSTNVGYGTDFHLRALSRLGPVKYLHRQSFAPLRLSAEAAE
ncbi:MAG TPA: ribonuclease HII [Candidatus Saccharimonadales bacterium]|nr:ribonuclease HII [Candidatus Saccharimonadales bacterium]